MSNKIFTNMDAEVRFYDGTGTPFYLSLVFDKGDFSAPMGRPKAPQTLQMERGRMSANAHYTKGGDADMMAPLELAMSSLLGDLDGQGHLRDWLHGRTVNSNTIVTTKGTTKNDGVNFNPTFADEPTRICCNVEIKYDGDTDVVYKYNEVEFPLDQQNISESAEEVPIAMKGDIYGTIVDTDATFTAGTDVTA